jgi:cbb3-type cytochrome oxidase subunit 3
MNTYRKNAVWTGVLYLLGTVFGVTGGIIGGEVLSSLITGKPLAGVDMLGLAAANSSRITAGAFFTLLMGISLVGMTVFLYPVLRKASKELAMGMLLFRGALEGVFYCISTLTFLTLVAVGNNYIATGAESTVLPSIGNLLYQFASLTAPVSSIIFLIGATCIYLVLFRTRLIPRWLTVWGMDPGIGFYLEMVIAPQEIVMAIWLIVKGFNPSAIAGLSSNSKI